MPRRMIDGEIRKSGSLSRVSLQAGYTFVLLMTAADDQGRSDGCVLGLRSELFPRRRDISDDNVQAWLAELMAEGCLHVYEVGGEAYIHFPEWETYQHLRTPSKPRRPDPEGHCRGCDPSLKEEAGSGKREAGGDSRTSQLISATLGKKPETSGKSRKPRRKSPTRKSEVPDNLCDEDMEKLLLYAQKNYPTLVPDLGEHVHRCLLNIRKTNNKNNVSDFYAACQLWLGNELKFYGGGNGKSRKGTRGGQGRSLAEIALDPGIE